MKDAKNEPGVAPADCPFCSNAIVAQAIVSNDLVYALADTNPVTPGHSLVIPRRHTPDYFTMTDEERCAAAALVDELRQTLLRRDPAIDGFNVGVNCGAVAGQTIFHAHIHLIPRRQGDTPWPRGGVRGVVPAKMNY